ncbi:hypothetical protein ACUR5C_05480 [Aliikangiella sp. IMCC44653]
MINKEYQHYHLSLVAGNDVAICRGSKQEMEKLALELSKFTGLPYIQAP